MGIKEVVVTEKMFQISETDVTALFQLTDYVFANESDKIEGSAAVHMAGELLAVTDKLRMAGARDTAKRSQALVLTPATTRALRDHLEGLTPENPFVDIDDVRMMLGALSRAKDGEGAALDEDELDQLIKMSECSTFNAVPSLEALRTRLDALSQPV